ncbi:recombinase RecF [Nocardia nova]|uniref:Nuclease SbcCD subunit C n=1 Tax=Nocardia nova TaxID=37330 RepID=A0A2S6AHF2_9NOCA|nr:AAA family ATPase [Nocardia nova]PPJ22150.1 recombinase RecF [Nocardia nova]PPJ34652.1 recombinase RecF [Nocardia nova]
MTDPLSDRTLLAPWIAEQIDGSDLPDEVGLLILTAFEGDQALDDYLGGSTPAQYAVEPAAAETASEARGTFLTSVQVEGFRGIGPATTLNLRPEPGLTIVAGRNGSGKSSISEALELTLTDSAFRWAGKKSTQWRDQWRNLHHPTARVAVSLVEEDNEPVVVTLHWTDDETDVNQHTTRTQRRGGKQQIGRGDLGWDGPLQRFRPILSYDELGAMLNGTPSDLHDAISRVLGVEQLTAVINRISMRHKDYKAPGDELVKRRKVLADAVAELDDERATAVAPLLKKTAPDLIRLRALLHETKTCASGPVPQLRELANLTVPVTPDNAIAIAKRLRESDAEVTKLNDAASDRKLSTLRLLEQALQVHEEHGDMACPVCHDGTLNATWARESRAAVSADRQHLAALNDSRKLRELAHAAAVHALQPAPGVLDRSPVQELDETVAAARRAWQGWAAIMSGPVAPTTTQLADHLETHAAALSDAVDAVTKATAACIAEREDRWQPVQSELQSWCAAWEAWLAAKPVVDQLNDAKKWLQDNDRRLRNERLAPIRVGVQHAWSMLRQESNVEIGDLCLEGSATRRKLRIDSLVDGVAADGLTVLSQGELHALALALFLPRATMAESPFRFLILDDPVQAMDPAKVDGLVTLLSELAQTRQVVVFSHDDRLPAAVRRGDFAATIVEVNRGKDSQVSITTLTDPARRYIEDAFGLVLEYENGKLPDEAMRRTLPGMLRFAVETAARHTYFTRNIRAGRSLEILESEWGAAATTRAKVILGVFGEPQANHVLEQWARAPYQKSALHIAGPKMHNGLTPASDPRQAAKDVQRLVDDIEKAGK